jgi:hypothetical protein
MKAAGKLLRGPNEVNGPSRVCHEQMLDVRPRDNSPNRPLGRVAVRGYGAA